MPILISFKEARSKKRALHQAEAALAKAGVIFKIGIDPYADTRTWSIISGAQVISTEEK